MALLRPYRHTSLPVEDFLELERESTVRHEYVGGQIFAFAGATEAHNLIATNLITALATAARGTQCRVYPSDMLLRAAEQVFYYPDIMVVCEPQDTGTIFKSRPSTIVEILSPSTATTDLREKLFVYRSLPSMSTYVIVSQDERRVRTHLRDENGAWSEFDVAGAGNVRILQPELILTLDQIYDGVPL